MELQFAGSIDGEGSAIVHFGAVTGGLKNSLDALSLSAG